MVENREKQDKQDIKNLLHQLKWMTVLAHHANELNDKKSDFQSYIDEQA